MLAFFEAVLMLAGMIIGVGMFAIPFSFAAAGFWLGAFELIILALAVLALHLLYGEIVLATPRYHRLPGYIRIYLGSRAAGVAWVSTLVGTIGTLLAYIIVGSLFLQAIFGAMAPRMHGMGWAIALAGAVCAITFFPLRKEAAINGLLTIFEIGFIGVLSLWLLPDVSLPHFSGIYPAHLFMPYGVLLFALAGASVIPDVAQLLRRNKRRTRLAIITGSAVPPVIYFLFAFGVVGVSGPATSEEAIAGLGAVLGSSVVVWGSAAGLLAVLTSYIALSENFQALLTLDMGLRRRTAWIAASAIPFVVYLAGLQNFIAIISIVGIVAFAVDGTLFFLMGRKIRQQTQKPVSTGISVSAVAGYVVGATIIIGVIAQLAHAW